MVGVNLPVSAGDLLLATKLYIPPARARRVDRARLVERMKAAAWRPLTLICAPAGYGKTTLLSQWIPQNEHCVTWLSLDEGDNDPARFWRYFLAALHTLNPELGENSRRLLESSQAPRLEAVLSLAINELAALDYEFSHVFDDYQLIENPEIDKGMAFLIEHLPPNVHLVIASRTDPALPLARWRARRQMAELRSNDLRFTVEEATAFFNQLMRLDLSSSEIAALEDRTEGWVAGLQLAALSIKDHDDRAGFIAAFAGSHRFVIDYLAEEVLNLQPEPVRQFLLSTCVLNRLSGPLCNALTGGSGAQTMLEQLEQANLFVVPLDDDRNWYRYHHLFAEVLQARLQQDQPDLKAEMHRRASAWYEAYGSVAEAVHHALEAGATDRAAALIEQQRWVLLGRGEANTLHRWLDQLPRETVHSRPGLSLAYGWIFSLLEEPEAIEARLQAAENALGTAAPNAADDGENGNAMRGEIATLRAEAALGRSDIPAAVALCQHALDLLPKNNLMMRGVTTYFLGHGERRAGRMAEAAQAYTEASELGLQTDNLLLALHALANLTSVQIALGRLSEAEETSQRILEITAERERQHWPVAGLAFQGLGRLLYERNDLVGAASCLRQGVDFGQRGGLIGLEINCRTALAFTLQAQSGQRDADEMLAKIAALNEQHHHPVYAAEAAAQEARLRLMQGCRKHAAAWAESCGLSPEDPELPYGRETEYLTLARVLLKQAEFETVATLLKRLLLEAESDQRAGSVIEILSLRALVMQATDDRLQALDMLEQALEMAEPEGYARIFIDEGAPMRALLVDYKARLENQLRAAAEGGSYRLLAYTGKLLAGFSPSLETEKTGAQPLEEALSERELEVLQLIGAGLTNQEIAAQLVVAVSTVKSHINNLYGKLGARSRVQAITIARELGLLSD